MSFQWIETLFQRSEERNFGIWRNRRLRISGLVRTTTVLSISSRFFRISHLRQTCQIPRKFCVRLNASSLRIMRVINHLLIRRESFFFGQNTSDGIHGQIKCGDTFPRACQQSRYRSYDGSCNNLQNPTWGLANTRYGRLVYPRYSDGKHI